MTNYRYSPLPIEDYRVTSIPDCEVSQIMALEHSQSQAVWNLFWLSLPAVDALPEHGGSPDWYRHYQPTTGSCRAIVADALADEALYRKLLMHPTAFIDFFHREDPWPYECFETLGGDLWVTTVLKRAGQAEARMRQEQSTWTGFSNVYNMFGRPAAAA